MKKTLLYLLAALTLAALFAGCQNNGAATEPTAAATAAPTAAPTATAVPLLPNSIPDEVLNTVLFKETPEFLEYAQKTDPITLSIYYNVVVADPWTWGEDEVTAEIERLTGVTLEGTYATDKEGNQLTLMIASGDKLPDIIANVGVASTHLTELIDGGLIYPINELIDTYCPKMWDVLFPIETTYYNDGNGDFWYLGRQQILPGLEDYTVANGWYALRKDVYEDLGSPALSTPEDVWNYLALFDQNKADYPEIVYPWLDPVLLGTGNISVAYAMFGGIAQYSAGSYYCYDKDAGTVYTVVNTELGKKALKFYFDLAQAGYITQQSFALENMADELNAGKALLYAKMNVWEVAGANTALEQNLPGASYERILPIFEPGVDYHYYDAVFRSAVSATVITKDCIDPERAILFFEFMATEYGNLLATIGVYGQHWEYSTFPNGKLGFEYVGEAATDAATRVTLGLYNYNKLWWNITTNYDFFKSYFDIKDDSTRTEISSYVQRNTAVTAPNFVTFKSDSAEAVLDSQIKEIIGTYVTQIILAPDEASFNALYDEMIAALDGNGLTALQNAYAELCGTFVAKLVENGVEFVS